MADITIPPAALEAGARVLHANLELFEDLPWEDLSDADQDEYREQIRAAFLAMIEAWPNKESLNKPSDWHRYVVLCISEQTDDKA